MQSTTSAKSFLPFADNYSPPRSRTTAASIWAPQPQQLDSTWPNAIDTFSRDAERTVFRPQRGLRGFNPVFGSEDVFGPVGLVGPPRKRGIGAIGDGRKRQSPELDDDHIEQLLRALNLNSPAPCPQQPARALNSETVNLSGSPDVSPSSTTSALLTPTDLSPAKTSFDLKVTPPYEVQSLPSNVSPSSLLFDPGSPLKTRDFLSAANIPQSRLLEPPVSCTLPSGGFPFFDQYLENTSPALGTQPLYDSAFPQFVRRPDLSNLSSSTWRHQQVPEWRRTEGKPLNDFPISLPGEDSLLRTSPSQTAFPRQGSAGAHSHEPINFLSLLHPSSSPPYHVFVARIIKSSDQQASIFLQQKLKVADLEERHKIIDAICARGFEMMSHRFGNWAVQRCLEAAATVEERRKIVGCMRDRVVDLATNCYGCHVLQKALDCEEDIRLLIVSELLLGDPALTLVNKHASHVWSKIMELSWTPPAPPIFAYVNKSLKGKWASLACHETGSLVVQHAFENLEDSAKDGIIDELLNQGSAVFGEITKNQWGSYCIQHILEHGSPKHRQMCLDHLIADLLDYATNEQGFKSVTKAFKEAGPETLARIVKRMCEPAKGGRRAMIVDLALSVTGSQLIANVLPQADKDQRTTLYECIRGHIVTLRGCKTGSKVIWLFDRMRAYYGY
ncbi:armadillo-type protein [Boletus edulis]|uniref:Armadillo-type protein n=1 Tax=Boletus edulis BED1 TaxID=1328754 RepID=A0AAD4BNM6_BOLED|nr:armadillo-type protein [Boletus edulis]KAF8435787.1 armadillo-type protein [Boletus edulis BED1]